MDRNTLQADKSPLTWHYVCHMCNIHFNVAVPRGPKEERAIRCVKCGSAEIERVDITTCAVLPTGG